MIILYQKKRKIVDLWDSGFSSKYLEEFDIVPIEDISAIPHCRLEIKNMRTEEGIQRYIVEIIQKTCNHPHILYGASPRASVALLHCSKALAAIRGRNFPIPEDVSDVAPSVLRHRLTLKAETELDGIKVASVISDIIKSIPVPR